MECPGCKTTNAYHGLVFWHCINEECLHYDARYVDDLLDDKRDDKLKAIRIFINNEED